MRSCNLIKGRVDLQSHGRLTVTDSPFKSCSERQYRVRRSRLRAGDGKGEVP